MQVLVNLRFSDGDFEHGFDKTNLSASIAGSKNSTELQTQLPAAPRIPELYKSWQNKYSELVETRVRKIVTEELVTSGFYTGNFSRGFSKQQPTNFSYYECQQNCNQYAEDLRTHINQWLVVIKSRLETEFELDTNSNSEILLTINTENITSRVTKDILHRLPWQEWDYFDNNSTFEAVLCLSEFQSSPLSKTDDGIFRRVRITSIFGDSKDIDVAGDKELIAKLQKRGAELINLEQPQRQDFIKLWDEPCDILFYSGHSESSIDGTVGSLQINSEENLNLQEIRNTFQEAIRKGLKLAIFNSCDGLGLAKQLADLHLPYIIVWREPVPDKIAIRFLEYFLSSYSEGKSLFKSVRDARIKIVELSNSAEKEKQIPGLEWLPIICKNTTYAAPTWEDLGGLTGKLPDCPYQGLSAFGEEDKEFFFGRDDVIADLVKEVNSKPLVPVIGASGSGKSSLVFAGLVPQLRNIGNVQIVSFRPGKNPFDALAVALNRICNTQSNNRLKELELEVGLQQNEQTLCNFIRNNYNLTSKNIPSSERFIIIADQFEELYTLTEDSLRQSFLDLLLYTVQNAPLFSLVLTLRADFMGKVLDYQPMGEAFKKYPPVLLTPMKREELQAAIEQPAAKLKVELQEGLAKKLIDDLGNQPGRLPLLEFTLSLLWEKHDKWYLTHKAYAEIGGLEKALAKYADDILNQLSAVDKEKAERIFIQLISPGEGTEDTKRKATRGEVGEDNWGLVEELANQRLVVTGWDESSQQETVEIVHEALIREWGMLREWIKSNRRFRVWQERLQFEVVKWEDKKYNRDYLLSGGGLGEAEVW
ncbi:MAG: CHAT domain-containing protein, partial [Cyanobacteria bacterium J06573_2]